jgi:LPXTG-site transpeptidase (sortase) family protein
MGVTSLAVVARSPLHPVGRPTLDDATTPLTFAKVAGLPVAKKPSSDSLVVALGSRPAGLDTLVPKTSTRPVMVAIQPGDIVAHVEAEGADAVTGEMDIPTDPKHVGWYEHGPVPGDAGSAVIAGHVAFNGKRGSFADLLDLEPGAVVLVTFDNSTVRTFRVTERREYAKADLPDELFRRSGPATLSLITCGGTFNTRTHSYADNVVVTAVPM